VERLCTPRAWKSFFAPLRPEDRSLHLVDAPSHVLSLEPAGAADRMLRVPAILRPSGTVSVNVN
jgi:hypothetical protein